MRLGTTNVPVNTPSLSGFNLIWSEWAKFIPANFSDDEAYVPVCLNVTFCPFTDMLFTGAAAGNKTPISFADPGSPAMFSNFRAPALIVTVALEAAAPNTSGAFTGRVRCFTSRTRALVPSLVMDTASLNLQP